MEDFSTILVAARERKGITQSQLAISAGLTPSYLSLLENRKKPPPSDRVCQRLAEVLGIPARDLLEVAHLQRSPETVQRRVRTLRGRLSRERRSRQRALESLLSPFLFPEAPSWIEGALGWLGLSPVRRRRLREVLAALGRRNQDRATAVSRLVDDLPERDRRLLLEALPKILSERRADAAASPTPAPQLFYALPPRETAPRAPYLLLWAGGAYRDLRKGDLLLVDPAVEPRADDLVLLRGPDEGPFVRQVVRSGTSFRLALPQGGGDAERTTGEDADPDVLLSESELRAHLGRHGAGVVVEIRRPARRHPG